MTRRYTSDFAEYLDRLLAEGLDVSTCMTRYTDVFAETLRNGNRMCLAGFLAAEHNELPAEVQNEVIKFGDMNEDWIHMVLVANKSEINEETRLRARAIFAAVTGAQLIAHSRGNCSVHLEIIAIYRKNGLIP